MDFPVLFESESDCCGCGACYAVCSNNAIIMKKDFAGFLYPEIIKENCVKCYSCLRVCGFKAAVSTKENVNK